MDSSLLKSILTIFCFILSVESYATDIKVTSVTASSQYPSDGASYYPENAADGNSNTAWFPKKTQSANKGEWIKFNFQGKHNIQTISIINGWIKNHQLFSLNSRVKRATIAFSNGAKITIALKDQKTPQTFDLGGVSTSWVKIIIEDIYPGTTWNQEAGITDVSFVRAPISKSIAVATHTVVKEQRQKKEKKVNKETVSINSVEPNVKEKEEKLIGRFVWKYDKQYERSNTKLKRFDNQIWEIRADHGYYSWLSARKNCKNSTFIVGKDIFDEFNLPSEKQTKTLWKYRRYIHPIQNKPFFSTWTTIAKKSDGKWWGAKHYNINRGDYAGWHHVDKANSAYFCVSNVKYNTDHIYLVDAKDIAKRTPIGLAKKIGVAQFNKLYKPTLPDKPTKAAPIKPIKLVKGEFETTVIFDERRKLEREKLEAKNKIVDERHQKMILKWQATILELKEYNDLKIQNYDQQQERLSILGTVMTMKYGKPLVKSVNYDADNQNFTITITTGYGRFEQSIKVPIKISHAPKFKKVLSKRGFIPTLEMVATPNGVKIVGVEEIKNPEELVELQVLSEAKGSVDRLTAFLAKFPSSTLASDAKHQIKVIQDKESARIAAQEYRQEKHETKARERAALRQQEVQKFEQQRATAERELPILGRCAIGSTVYHREKWSTTTSSGNVIADALFNASTKEQFIIVFNGVVTGFVGDKVEVVINNYGVKQTMGGGFLQQKTWRKYELNKYADKFIGKTQFYERSRCK